MNDKRLRGYVEEYNKDHNFTPKLMDLIDELQNSLHEMDNPNDFGERYVLGLILERIVFNSVEDKYIPENNFRKVSDSIYAAVKDILDKKEEMPRPIVNVLDAYKKEIVDKQLPVRKEIKIPLDGHSVICDVADLEGGEFRVSSYPFPYVINIDKNLSDPKRCKAVSNAFLKKIKEVDKRERIDKLCFVEKKKGPVGALPLLPLLVEKTGKKACIYRPHTDHKIKFSGLPPEPGENICIVYDLVVSGDGIVDTANSIKRFIKNKYPKKDVNPGYAVILGDLREESKKYVGNKDTKVEICPILHYPPSKFKKDLIKSLEKEYKDIEERASRDPYGVEVYTRGVETLIDEYGILEVIE